MVQEKYQEDKACDKRRRQQQDDDDDDDDNNSNNNNNIVMRVFSGVNGTRIEKTIEQQTIEHVYQLFLRTPLRCKGEWRHISTHSSALY